MWPASRFQPGSSCAPMAWATPRMMPPASVPHMLPRPPMITASKPKMSRAGPIAGSKLARTASSTPATATMASDSAIASANTWALFRPMSCATDWIVGGGAEGAAQRRAVEQPLQAGDHRDRERELDERQHADRKPAADRDAFDLDRAGVELDAVGGEQFKQPVLDDDREAERHQQRRQQIVAERAVEQAALQRVADDRHHRHDDDERQDRVDAERLHRHQRDIGRQHDQVAVGDVDEPHHAEDQRQPRREHGVEPAEQHALQDGVHPLHVTLRNTPRRFSPASVSSPRLAARRGPPAGNRHGARFSAPARCPARR